MLISPACLPVLALAYICERLLPRLEWAAKLELEGSCAGAGWLPGGLLLSSPISFFSPARFRRHLLVSRRRLAPTTSASNCTVLPASGPGRRHDPCSCNAGGWFWHGHFRSHITWPSGPGTFHSSTWMPHGSQCSHTINTMVIAAPVAWKMYPLSRCL